MPKEILLYNYYLSNYSVEALITKLEEAISDDVNLRVNCFGGEVYAAWGLFAKIKEHGAVHGKVDGIAASGAGNLLLYMKSVECLSVSRVMIHRADANVSTEAEKTLLNSINTDLRKQLEMKVDADTFKTVTGYTIDQMFNPETRVDIWLNPTQLKKLGIVSKVVQLTPEQEKKVASATAEIEAQAETSFAMKIAASLNPPTPTIEKSTPINMTIEKFKAEHPAIYEAVMQAGRQEGITAEHDRVNAWLPWAGVDAEAVVKGIKDVKACVTPATLSEFSAKAVSKNALAAAASESQEEVETEAGEPAKEDKADEKVIKAFASEVNKHLGREKAAAVK